MVKVQKPNPKTLVKEAKTIKKSNVFKKEKLPESKKAISVSNVMAKKEKLKLIEGSIGNKNSKAMKNVDKKKQSADAKLVQKEQIFVKDKKKTTESKKIAAVKKDITIESKQNKKKNSAIGNDQKNTAISAENQKPLGKKGNKKDNLKEATGPAKAKKNIEFNAKAGVGTVQNWKRKKPTAGKIEKKRDKPKRIIEALPFNEEHFNSVVNLKNIKDISKALKTMVEKELIDTKKSIFADYRYLLNICCYKIPYCPKRIVKLNLVHSMVDTKEDDVVIIVPDLQRGAKVDYEPTIQHYEDLFRENGITGLKIVPFNQLRQECTTFEAKRKFANSYDHFLCDGRIVSHVVGFGGSLFQKTRTTFHAVKLNDEKKYKRDIEKALKRTAYKQLKRGDLTSIPVGSHRCTINQLAQNIQLVVEQLKTLYPGGLGNIRNMHIKIDIAGTTALPLYISMAAAPADTPSVIGIREKRLLKLKREANAVLTQFNMSKSGEFVKLDKVQAERKRKIIEARNALVAEDLSDGVAIHNDADIVPAKKSKKGKTESAKGVKKQKDLKNKEEEENEEDEDEDDAKSNEHDEEDEDDDDAGDDDDDDDDEGDDDDKEDDDDDEEEDDCDDE